MGTGQEPIYLSELRYGIDFPFPPRCRTRKRFIKLLMSYQSFGITKREAKEWAKSVRAKGQSYQKAWNDFYYASFFW